MRADKAQSKEVENDVNGLLALQTAEAGRYIPSMSSVFKLLFRSYTRCRNLCIKFGYNRIQPNIWDKLFIC